MATYNTLTSLLKAICDVIRNKTDSTDTINAQDIPSAINSGWLKEIRAVLWETDATTQGEGVATLSADIRYYHYIELEFSTMVGSDSGSTITTSTFTVRIPRTQLQDTLSNDGTYPYFITFGGAMWNGQPYVKYLTMNNDTVISTDYTKVYYYPSANIIECTKTSTQYMVLKKITGIKYA